MTIKLIYLNSSSTLEIMVDTTCHYLYCMSRKIFQLNPDTFILKYNNKDIEDNSKLIYTILSRQDQDNFLNGEIEINIHSLKKTEIKNPHLPVLTTINDSSKKFKRNSVVVKMKKYPVICQICTLKNSIYYCRICDMFICFDCNVRNTEHRNHDKINLEDGDSFFGSDVYREELINQINVIDLAYQKANKYKLSDEEREKNFKYLFDSLEQIRNKSQILAMKNSMFNIDQEIIKDFIFEINEIPKPQKKCEIEKTFNTLNMKEVEIRNYIKCLNLIIIKAKYNVMLKEFFENMQNGFDIMKKEIDAKLSKCEEIKDMGIIDIKFYVEEKEKSKYNKKSSMKKSVSIDVNNIIDNKIKKNNKSLSKLNVKEIHEKLNSKKMSMQNLFTEKNINKKLLPKLYESYKFSHQKSKNLYNAEEKINNEKISTIPEKTTIGDYNSKNFNIQYHSCKKNKNKENKITEDYNFKSLDVSDIKKSNEKEIDEEKLRKDRVNLYKPKSRKKLSRLSLMSRKTINVINSKNESKSQMHLSRYSDELNEINENETIKNIQDEKLGKSNNDRNKNKNLFKKNTKTDLGLGKFNTKYKLLYEDM